MSAIKLKFLIVTAFSSEDIPDVVGEDEFFKNKEILDQKLAIPGAFSPLYFNDQGVGLITTGIGIANASASMMAVGLSDLIDLTDAYIFIAGIGGLMPDAGELGTVVCIRHAVNSLCFEIDPRDRKAAPKFYKEKLPWLSGTDVIRLDESLMNRLQAIIAKETDVPVMIGDSLTADAFWHGEKLAGWASHWVREWAGDNAHFCISDMENTGILTACSRLAEAGRCSMDKVAAIRTASNYVYEPGVAADVSIKNHDSFDLAVENTYLAIKSVMTHL